MDTTKFKDRGTLRSYFLKNKIPTEANFAELINSTVNMFDDGLYKPAGDPLSIVAAGDAASPQKLINCYGNANDANPSWALQMNPRTDQNNPASARAGFSISDGLGNSRLFIDRTTGNIGVGTLEPNSKLTLATASGASYLNLKDGAHEILMGVDAAGGIVSVMSNHDLSFRTGVNNERMRITAAGAVGVGTSNPSGRLDIANVLRFGLDEGSSGGRSISFSRDAGDEINAGKISYKGGFGDSLNIVGAGVAPRKIKFFDNVEITGALTPSQGNLESNGILFPKNPGGGGLDSAWMRYFPRAGENCTLEIGTANDPQDHIALMPSGNVGIGTREPSHKFHVLAADAVGLFESTGGEACLRFSTAEGLNNRVEIANRPGGRLSFGTGGKSDAFTITRDGMVGIGTTAPATPLHIVTAVGADIPGYGNPMAWGQHIEFAATGMWGLTDSYGILHTWDSDTFFIGMKSEGANRKDAIIAFGDDVDDSLRFLSVPGGRLPLLLSGGSAPVPPVEHLRITAAGFLKSPKWRVTQVLNNMQGNLPQSGQFVSGGGTLLIICSGSGYGNESDNIGMSIQLDANSIGAARCFTNEGGSHKAFTCNPIVHGNVAAGTHMLTLSELAGTSTDSNDWFNVTVLEFPF